jgi:antibiotic biosynthesis monooxygenase (ABM) superfamily enzyme
MLYPAATSAEALRYPSGHREQITGFKNKEEAQKWMKSDKCREWVKKRGYEGR